MAAAAGVEARALASARVEWTAAIIGVRILFALGSWWKGRGPVPRLAELMNAMQAVKTSSDNVARIIKVIDEIAFQKNILASNAAVEAARAGADGMGFAVVIDEVGNLAQRSAQAAKETSELIEQSIAASHRGMDKLGTVTGAFESISRDLQTVTDLASAVGESSNAQSQSLDEVTRLIEEADHMTSHAIEGAERGAVAGQDVRAQGRGAGEDGRGRGAVGSLADRPEACRTAKL